MPELPEAEVLVLGLSELLPDKKILGIKLIWHKSFISNAQNADKYLLNSKITSVKRLGKAIIINLNTNYSLAIHLRMTGQLVYEDNLPINNKVKRFGAGHPSDSLIGGLPDRSTRVIIMLDNAKLYFNDQRKFGQIKLLPTNEISKQCFFKTLGPDPLNISAKQFIKRIKLRPNSIIKAVLLDQKIIAGVGNIYADESLFLAKINPKTRVKNLSNYQLTDLFNALTNILILSIKKGGSTDRNYVNAKGQKGSYLSFAHVFRRNGSNCLVCGTIIEKIKVAGRGTHICIKCQSIG